MRAEELRKSILQQVVQGRLVSQDPNDEPASELLVRIRAQKEQLIKDKKVKRDKNESQIFRGEDGLFYETIGKTTTCINDEIPFEIPDSWEWCRLGTAINLLSGRDLSPNQYNAESKGIPYITGASNICDDQIVVSRWTEEPIVVSRFGDLLLTCKGTIGTMALNEIGNIHIARQIMALSPYIFKIDYLFAFLRSYISKFKSKAKSMIPGISREDVLDAMFPMPPLAEQQRIVERLKELEPMLSEYDKLEKAEVALVQAMPIELKKSILQYAIQGKLVAQDAADEPASELMKRIREEKAQLVKEKKIKRDKNESIITRGADGSFYETIGKETTCIDSEIPFDIPTTWEWCRLGALSNFGKSPSINPDDIDGDCWVLDLEDVEKQTGVLLQKKRCRDMSISSTKSIFKSGNVLYSKLRPYLNKVIIADEDGCCTSEILPLTFDIVESRYAQILLMSPYFIDYAMSFSYGVKMPRLGTKDGANALFPLPPLAEQQRIVEKLNQVTELLNI